MKPDIKTQLLDAAQRLVQTRGRSRAELAKKSDPASLARLWYAALQGGLLLGRAGRAEILDDVAKALRRLAERKMIL